MIKENTIDSKIQAWQFCSRTAFALVAAMAMAMLFALAASSASAATAAPAWRIESVANPTAFSSNDTTEAQGGKCAPCDKYQIRLTNVGGVASNGEPITVTDTLPTGVTAGSAGNSDEEWSCTAKPECTTSTRVGALGQAPALTVYVQVDPSVPADSTGTNVVTVKGGGAAPVKAEVTTPLNPSTSLSFGLADFGSYLADLAGAPDTQAADHTNSLTTSFDVTSVANHATGGRATNTLATEDVKDVVVDLPPGFVGNPQATQQCPLNALVSSSFSSGCPAASQVGRLSFNGHGSYEGEAGPVQGGRQNTPVYNMIPEHGFPAEFGFLFAGFPVTMYASVVGSGAETHVRVTVPGLPAAAVVGFQGAVVTFFGDPAERDAKLQQEALEAELKKSEFEQEVTLEYKVPEELFTPVAFLTSPSGCSGKLETMIHVDSWENPGVHNPDGTPNFTDPNWKTTAVPAETPAMEGCGALHFNPTISLTPDIQQAGAPTGLGVNLEVPQSSDPSIPATPDLKETVVKLPAGMVVSPSAANGLGVCSPEQIGLENNDTPTCPDSSKIGTVEVETPLLPPHTLKGSVYLAQQGNAGAAQGSNPFGSLLAIYVVVEGSGVVVKLPGKVEANASTGQLTATFAESPQLPFSDFMLHFESGPRAPLANPPACGTYTPEATLSSWSGQTVQSNRPFAITQGEGGGACPGSGFAPSFTAGTTNNQAGASSPLSVTFARSDQDQDLGGIAVTMPPGLLGKVAGIPQCPEAQANAGTCGAESEIGEASTAVGPGSDPYWVKGGKVYLTGPYNGGPFGLSVVVPTEAGPFKLTGNAGLGKEVVRASIRVNPSTAQITVVSNPLPSILEGIPLQIRTVNVTVNRAGFTFNPTNCEASSVGATITSTAGASASVSSPFQAANCAALPFKPVLTASTQGATSKANGASLVVKIAYRPGEANIHKVDLALPKALPSRLTTLHQACTEAQFNSDPAACPPGSFIGTATAHTPVLNSPLAGPAILVSHGGAAFPDVEFMLQGEGVEIVLDGKTQIKNGITYSKFETVPDAPVSSFETVLPEGPHSILGTNLPASAKYNLCGQRLAMGTTITGQNGAQIIQTTKIAVTGCSTSLSFTHSIKKKTLTLHVYAPAAGRITASGKGLTTKTKTAKGREDLTITLKQKKAGKLKTKIKLTFTPSKGKRQTKTVKARFTR